MSQRWRYISERGNRWVIAVLARTVLLFGRRGMVVLLYPTALYYLLFAGTARRASRQFLRRALGREPRWRELYRHLLTFSLVSADRILFLSRRYQQFDIRIHGEDLFLSRELNGAVVVTAHFGSFDVLRATGRDDLNMRPRVLLDKQHNTNALALIQQLDPHLAEGVVDAAQDGPTLALILGEAVRRGEIVGIMADRHGLREPTVTRDFFGHPAQFPLGPWHLAGALRVPILACFGVYLGGNRYDMHFKLLGEPTQTSRQARRQAVNDCQARFVEHLESLAQRYPYNWFNFYDFWHHDAPGDH